MPITGQGWEMLITREREDRRNGRRRTVGKYKIFHNGREQTAANLKGTVAETRGPGDNATAGNNRRVKAGRYPLNTQAGSKYVTLNYTSNTNPAAIPRPGIELGRTGNRSEILIHPGRGFLSSVGCINPCKSLPNASEDITFSTSRERTIAIIDDMKSFLGSQFPNRNGRSIPNAFVVIDGEP
jgi:hypothetical protein